MKIPFLLSFLFLLTIQVFAQSSKYNKVTEPDLLTFSGFLTFFCILFVISVLIMRWLNKPTKKKDGRTATGYRITNPGLNYSTTKILIISFFIGIIGAFLGIVPKKDATLSTNKKSNKTETPKTEDRQVTQEPQEQQTANSKYASHNFYGNNVTEYLETRADGSVFYSTSTRLNPVKMIVKKIADDEFELTFPSGAGDNQRYRMRKTSGNLVVSIPNTDAKEQIYTDITNAGSL